MYYFFFDQRDELNILRDVFQAISKGVVDEVIKLATCKGNGD